MIFRRSIILSSFVFARQKTSPFAASRRACREVGLQRRRSADHDKIMTGSAEKPHLFL